MEIKVLFDSKAIDERFSIGWGVSFLVGGILFDTGEKGESLLQNMEQMGIFARDISTVVISHDHWDHTGGLWELLAQNPRIKVYACPNFGSETKDKVRSFGAELVEADSLTRITDSVYTTGEMAGEYSGEYIAEQSLTVKSEKGLVILAGCAHQGIISVLEKVKADLQDEIYLVMGGFHLMGKRESAVNLIIERCRTLGVTRVGPTHCTGKEAEELFKAEYKDDFVPSRVGMVIEI